MNTESASGFAAISRRELMLGAGALCLVQGRAAHAQFLRARPIEGSFLEDVRYLLREQDLGRDGVTYEMRDAPGDGVVVIEGLARLESTVEQSFKVLTDFEHFKEWMPTVVASTVESRAGDVIKTRVTHSVAPLGRWDCHQMYRITDEGRRKTIDGVITHCVVDASRSRYVLERGIQPGMSLIRYYQVVKLNAWIPRPLLNAYVKREYRHASSALRERIAQVSAVPGSAL